MPTDSTDSGHFLDRPRLRSMLDEARGRRLTALIAGPGYGKTTVLGQWLRGEAAAWHTATSPDAEFASFARGVIDAIRLREPAISTDLRLATEGVAAPRAAGEPYNDPKPEALAGALCQDLGSRLTEELVLVIDDAHLLGEDGGSARFLAAVCRNAPPRLHVVIASRHSLPFATARLQLDGHAVEIGADDLRFTDDEVSNLMAKDGREVDPGEVERVAAQTGGWPVAVAFANRARATGGDGSAVYSPPARRALFEYLAEEVLASEPPSRLVALAAAANLPWVTPPLLEQAIPESSSGDLFESGHRSIYLTRAAGYPGAVTLTPLVRRFVLERYPIAGPELKELRAAAADWYQSHGAEAEALTCLIAQGSTVEVAKLLQRRGQAMLTQGMARQVVEAVEILDRDEVSADLLLLEAEARQTLGDWEGAESCYRVLTPETGPVESRLAWRLGLLHHMRGNGDAALDAYDRAAPDTGEIADRAALLGWTASAHWLRGERDRAQQLADQALRLASEANDSRSLATAHTVLALVAAMDGDRAGNDAHYLRALEHAERSRDVMQTIRIRSNRGSHFLEEGQFDRAMAETNAALRLADLCGFELWRAMTISNRAQILAYRGNLDEALGELAQARSIFRRLGSALEAYPLAHMGEVYEGRGDTALARAAFQEAVALAEGPADLQALTPALSGLARILAADDPDAAAACAKRARSVASVLGHAKALVASGVIARTEGDAATARDFAHRAAEVARTRSDLPGLAEALELEASVSPDPAATRGLLEQAQSLWTEMKVPVAQARVEIALARVEGGAEGAFRAEAAAETLQRLGAKLPALEARRLAQTLSHSAGGDVTIKTLGGFAVIRHGERVPPSTWQSRVAREILWMLVAQRGRPLHREVIIERLWPDEAVAKTGNRLSVALTTIRNVLDPDRSGNGDHFIHSDRETVSLDLGVVSVDIETFFHEAKRGIDLGRSGQTEQSLAALRLAEARYVGDFLEEDPYATWAVGLREEARSVYMTIATTLAEAEASAGNHDSAARHYLRVLERDPFNEPAHLGVVGAMVASGRHGTARRLYSIYSSRMGELGVEPASFPG